jgi:hypothetical protein
MRMMVLPLKSKHCGWWKQTTKLGGALRPLGLARQERYNSRQRASELAARPQTTLILVGLDRAARSDANDGIVVKIEALWVVESNY